MIHSKKELCLYLQIDARRYTDGKPGFIDCLLHNEAWYIHCYLRHLRHVEYYQNLYGRLHPLFLWHFFRYKRLGFKLRITIYPNTVGPGLRIYHVGDFIHIGPHTSIGKNCTLLPGVVFGNKYEQAGSNQTVTVGDDCYFGLGARIFGPLTIGNNVSVGANAVVTKDIPDNAVVGGVPARVIKYKNND